MRPVYTISIDGNPIDLQGHLLLLQVVDQAATDGDQLTLDIADPEGRIAWPSHGAQIEVELGYAHDELVDMGLYVVDEVEVRNPPRVISVRAQPAEWQSQRVKQRKTRCWMDTKLKLIVEELAAEAGYIPAIALALENEEVTRFDRNNEAVAGCLTRLARKYHAAATIKRGKLLFVPRGTGESVTGIIPTVAIAESACVSWRAAMADRNKYGSVEARWRDWHDAEDKWTKASGGEGEAVYRMRQTFPDERMAIVSATNKLRALRQACGAVSLTLPGAPNIFAGAPLALTGFADRVDGTDWVADSVTHRLDGGGGYVTTIDAKPKLEPGESGTDIEPRAL